MAEIFYFPEEKTLCWVAGYTWDNNTDNVNNMIESLQENAKRFSEMAGIDISLVFTRTIQHSRRYKYMRIFYSLEFNGQLPEGTFTVSGNGWTMNKWLTD